MHFRTNDVPDSALLNEALQAHITTNMFACVSGFMKIDHVDITPLDGSTATASFPAGTAWKGNAGDKPIPAVAQVIKLTTLKRGRSHRGRVFLPNVDEAVFEGGGLADVQFSLTVPAWSAFRDAMETDGWPLVVASYKLATADAVTVTTPEKIACTQRRRQSRLRG